MSKFLSKILVIQAIAGLSGLAIAAPQNKSPCEDEGLIKSVMNLLVETNKLNADDLSFDLSNIKLVQSKPVKGKKSSNNNITCRAHLNLKKSNQIVDSLDLSYGVSYSASGEASIFFNPVRSNSK
jgi:hypothetical protein